MGWIYRFYCLGGRDETHKAFRIILSLGLDDLYTNPDSTGGEMNPEIEELKKETERLKRLSRIFERIQWFFLGVAVMAITYGLLTRIGALG